VEEDELGAYTFLPWVKSGISAHIIQDAPSLTSNRTSLDVQIGIKKYRIDGTQEDVYAPKKTVELMGPGDVVGLQKRFIIRRDPEPNSQRVERNYFPLIEFSQADFPWRFTPFKPNVDNPNRLTPWITLIVLKRDEFEGPHKGLLLPEITIKKPQNSLPDLSQAWAWTHCQVMGRVEERDDLIQILANTPYNAISRILAPRRLEENQKYYVFLVPTFEVGRRASIGEKYDDIPGKDLAWNQNLIDELKMGIYDSWEFKTGVSGDFETLVENLEPIILGDDIGIRDLSVFDHGFSEIPPISRPISYSGALLSPAANNVRKQLNVRTFEITNTDSDESFTEELRDFINKLKKFLDIDELYRWHFVNNNQLDDNDPIISLPKYGRWQAAKNLVTRLTSESENPDWINELDIPRDIKNSFKNDPPYLWFEDLNLDPANRATAGLGTTVIQKIQEEIMEAAWDQAGDIKIANDKLKWAQLSRVLSTNLYNKTFKKLDQDEFISITSPLHNKLLVQETSSGKNKTLGKIFLESPIPRAFLEPSFKKITRRRGKTHRKVFNNDINIHQSILEKYNKNPSNPNPNPITNEDILSFDNSFPESSIKEENFSKESIIAPSFFKKLLIKVAKYCKHHRVLYLIYLILKLILKVFFKYDDVDQYNDEEVERFTNIAIKIEESIPDVYSTIPEKEGVILQLDQIYNQIINVVDPKRTIERKVRFEVHRPPRLLESEKEFLEPNILTYFKIKKPMYKPLSELCEELFLPGVGELKDEIVSILQTNPVFMNSYMSGINSAIASECLWREYPTDLRGSYSRQFWDPSIAVEFERSTRLNQKRSRDPRIEALTPDIEEEIHEKYRDIDEMHKWNNRTLDISRGDTSATRTVLIVKSELFRRYPRTVVYAMRGIVHTGDDGKNIPVIPTIRDPNYNPEGDEEAHEGYLYPDKAANAEVERPIFSGSIGSDINFFGFEIPPEEIMGNLENLTDDEDAGWFFILQDPPSEARFGADENENPVEIDDWNDVCWGHFAKTPSEYIDIRGVGESRELPIEEADEFLAARGVRWDTHAGNHAFATLQVPVRVARHGSEMVLKNDNNSNNSQW